MPDSISGDNQNLAMILGEMRGQQREMVHTMNNLSAKFDGLAREVIGLGPLATEVAEMRTRLAVLEKAHERQEGGKGALMAVLKSPSIAWLVGAAVTAWAILTGRLHA